MLGYCVASGFELAINDPQFLSDAQKKTLDSADKLLTGGKGKGLGDPNLTQEQTMKLIGDNFSNSNGGAPTLNLLMQQLTMANNVTYDKDSGKWVNTMAKHNQITNHGQPDLINGTSTTFDYNKGEYQTQKLSQTEMLYHMQEQYGFGL